MIEAKHSAQCKRNGLVNDSHMVVTCYCRKALAIGFAKAAFLFLLFLSFGCNASFGFGPVERTFTAQSHAVAKQGQDTSALRAQLQRAGIEPHIDSIREYLSSILPSESNREQVLSWMKELSSESFAVRENATRNLLNRPFVGLDDLRNAMETYADAEAKYRLKMVIESRRSGQLRNNIESVFRYVEAEQLTGLQAEIIQTATQLDDANLLQVGEAALIATVNEQDQAMLTSMLEDSRWQVRMLSLSSLANGLEVEKSKLSFLAKDSSPQVRIAFAEALIRRTDKESIPLLISVLRDLEANGSAEFEDTQLRMLKSRCAFLLRSATKHSFVYAVFGEQSERLENLKQFEDWFASVGDDIEIDSTLRPTRLGRILIGRYSEGEVVELDEDFKVRWRAPLPSAFACQGQPNGNRLVAQYSGGRVVEYDVDGKIVWEMDSLPGSISGVQRLANGNTLLACGQFGDTIVEVTREKEIVWKVTVPGKPVHAVRLDSGLTLVSLMGLNKIVEIDREGEVVWEMGLKGKPYHAQRLDNGNTLVKYSSSNAEEYDRKGNLINEYPCGDGYTSERLPDGSTMVSDRNGFRILDGSKEVRRSHDEFKNYIYVDFF